MDAYYMKLALQAARQGFGKTFTNPLVGAVIVQGSEIIATGAHLEFGHAHAEKNALTNCQTPEKLLNSTLYVTLEPCNHQGKQPPCTEAIIASGIQRVVVGQLDPNPLVAGEGIRKLRENGLQVVTHVLEEEVRELNPFYNFFYQEKRPYIVLKQAVSLDGKIALNGERTAITGAEVYTRVRAERNLYQGILVGSQTVLTDNPQLLGAGAPKYPAARIVLDRRGRTLGQTDLALFKNAQSQVFIFTEKAAEQVKLPPHVTIVSEKDLTLQFVLEELTRLGVQSLYVEGGAAIHDAFLADGYWDEIVTYMAPKIIGGNGVPAMHSDRQVSQLLTLKNVTHEKIGADMRIAGSRC